MASMTKASLQVPNGGPVAVSCRLAMSLGALYVAKVDRRGEGDALGGLPRLDRLDQKAAKAG
jgi:hypothetical protein